MSFQFFNFAKIRSRPLCTICESRFMVGTHISKHNSHSMFSGWLVDLGQPRTNQSINRD